MNKFKGTLILSAFIACSMSLSSCSQNNTGDSNASSQSSATTQQQTQTSDAEVSTEPAVTEQLIKEIDESRKVISLEEIAEKNSFSNVLSESVTTYECTARYYDDNGNDQKKIYKAVRITGKSVRYITDDSSGDKYYLDSEAGKLYSDLYNSYGVPNGIKFMDDQSAKEEIDRIDAEQNAFSQYAVITDTELSDGVLTVTSETPVNEDTKWDFLDFFEYINIEEDFTKIRTVYILDAETKILNTKAVYGIDKKDNVVMIGVFDFKYSSDDIGTPDFVNKIESMTDLRTIKVTDADKNVIEYSVPKNVLFSFPVPVGYMMYSDPEGNNYLSYDDCMDTDAEVYILPY